MTNVLPSCSSVPFIIFFDIKICDLHTVTEKKKSHSSVITTDTVEQLFLMASDSRDALILISSICPTQIAGLGIGDNRPIWYHMDVLGTSTVNHREYF